MLEQRESAKPLAAMAYCYKEILCYVFCMPRYTNTTTLTDGQLDQLSSTLVHFSSRYRQLKEMMHSKGLNRIEVTHAASLKDAMDAVLRHINAAYSALDAALLAELDFGAPAEEAPPDDDVVNRDKKDAESVFKNATEGMKPAKNRKRKRGSERRG
jgi:hypothetical protein